MNVQDFQQLVSGTAGDFPVISGLKRPTGEQKGKEREREKETETPYMNSKDT